MNKNIVIVDIDGTISKIGERLKYLQCEPKDWDSFYNDCFNDEPIPEIIMLVEALHKAKHQIVFCTGRRESVEGKTIEWIEKFIGLDFFHYDYLLLMRADNDRRPDVEVKPELLRNAGIDFNEILFVLEDRDCMVKKFREMGLKCLQVTDGNY